MDRRDFLVVAGALAYEAAVGTPEWLRAQQTALLPEADSTIRIAPVSVELAPGITVCPTGYNGTSPGSLLRMREGVPITVEVHNELDHPELLDWNGQFVSEEVDGSAEEGTPPVPARGSRRYWFAPRPADTTVRFSWTSTVGSRSSRTWDLQITDSNAHGCRALGANPIPKAHSGTPEPLRTAIPSNRHKADGYQTMRSPGGSHQATEIDPPISDRGVQNGTVPHD